MNLFLFLSDGGLAIRFLIALPNRTGVFDRRLLLDNLFVNGFLFLDAAVSIFPKGNFSSKGLGRRAVAAAAAGRPRSRGCCCSRRQGINRINGFDRAAALGEGRRLEGIIKINKETITSFC